MTMEMNSHEMYRWLFGVVVTALGPVSTEMGDRLQTGKPPRYVTSHIG